MKKLLKLNPQYPISIGLILVFAGPFFLDEKSEIGFWIFTLLGAFIGGAGVRIAFIQSKKR